MRKSVPSSSPSIQTEIGYGNQLAKPSSHHTVKTTTTCGVHLGKVERHPRGYEKERERKTKAKFSNEQGSVQRAVQGTTTQNGQIKKLQLLNQSQVLPPPPLPPTSTPPSPFPKNSSSPLPPPTQNIFCLQFLLSPTSSSSSSSLIIAGSIFIKYFCYKHTLKKGLETFFNSF